MDSFVLGFGLLSKVEQLYSPPANRCSKVNIEWGESSRIQNTHIPDNQRDIHRFIHMSIFYERQCVTDKGEQLLNNKATNSRPWTNHLDCMSLFSSVTPHPSPYQSCCSGRAQQVFHFYQNRLLLESACLLHILCCLLVPTILAEAPFCLREECNLTNFRKDEI